MYQAKAFNYIQLVAAVTLLYLLLHYNDKGYSCRVFRTNKCNTNQKGRMIYISMVIVMSGLCFLRC